MTPFDTALRLMAGTGTTAHPEFVAAYMEVEQARSPFFATLWLMDANARRRARALDRARALLDELIWRAEIAEDAARIEGADEHDEWSLS